METYVDQYYDDGYGVFELVPNTDVHTVGEFGWTPLHRACQMNQTDEVAQLIQQGADCNAKTTFSKESPLFRYGITPLHVACRYSASGVLICALLRGNADINAQDDFGITPLHVVCAREQLYYIDFLLFHGADPNIRNHDGCTPLRTFGHKHSDVTMPPCGERIEHLIAAGADIDATNNDGETLLHDCAAVGDILMLAFLVRHGADYTISDNHGRRVIDGEWRDIVAFIVNELKGKARPFVTPLALAAVDRLGVASPAHWFASDTNLVKIVFDFILF